MNAESVYKLIPGYDPWATAGECEFDACAATKAIDFFRLALRHIEGALAGKPFILEPWQRAIVGNLFGWKRPDGTRRYRELFVYVPRKNGKTPLCAGIAAYILFFDSEHGQQNVCAAGERDQATYLFRQLCGMIRQEPELEKRCEIYGERGTNQTRSVFVPSTNSYLRVISAEAGTKHGGNLHLAMIDELHVQPNRDLMDVLRTSFASANRKQPLLVSITTADFERESICNELHAYASKVRDGVIDDPAFLPVIYETARDADWTSPEVWRATNPNLGVSVSEEYLRRECARAREEPTYENTFKRLHLNMKTEQAIRWLSLDKWDTSDAVFEEAEIAGQPCWCGLDLATTTDLAALAAVFKIEDRYRALFRFWVPEQNAQKRERRDRVPYTQWIRDGWITATPGDVIDYDRIRADINELGKQYHIQEIACDRWNAQQIITQLDGDGFTIFPFGQGYASMSGPTKELEKLVIGGQVACNRNPVVRWMAGNVTVETDAAENYKPSKKKSTERIDGIVALIMALGRASVHKSAVSVYEAADKELVFL